MKKQIAGFLDKLTTLPFQRIDLLKNLVINLSKKIGNYEYNYLKKKFIRNGRKTKIDESFRYRILERFEIIDRTVPITTTPTDGLFLAEALLSMKAEGPIVECGCYAGGSTAKLSIISKILGKRLLIFDSFEGLPEVNQYNKKDYIM